MSGWCPDDNPLLAASPLTSLYSQSLDLVQSVYPGMDPSYYQQFGYGQHADTVASQCPTADQPGQPLGTHQPLGSSSSLSSYDGPDQYLDLDSREQLQQVQSVLYELLQNQDEGRRHLMMEQEELKDQDIPKGAIDVTSLSSPAAHSSGYCSADEDHSYSSSKTQETYSPGVQSPGNQSSIDTNSQPQTPPSVSSPTSQTNGNGVTPAMLEKMQDFSPEDLNLFDMIGEILPPSSLATTQAGGDSWMTGIDNEIEMIDVDGAESDPILIDMMKDSEKQASMQQMGDNKQNGDRSSMPVMCSLESLMPSPATSAVITQSNVMLSSATIAQNTGTMASSKERLSGSTQLKSSLNKGQSIIVPMSVPTSMDTNQSKTTITVAEFPDSMLADSEGNVIENNNEFALKFAENMVDQEISATLANYLEADNLMESSAPSVPDPSLNGLSDSTFNLITDDEATSVANSSLSHFLTSSNPVTSSPSSSSPPAITSSSRQPNTTTAYQIQTTVASTKPMEFATPHSRPPISAHMPRHNSMSNLNPKPPVSISRAISHPQLQKLNTRSSLSNNSNSSTSSTSNNSKSVQSHSSMAYPGCDDHRYTSKQLESPPHNSHSKSTSHRNCHRSNGGNRHHSYSHHSLHNSNHNSHSHPRRLLEQFLLTKEKLNPNKGSDAALAAQGISQLQLDDVAARMDQNETLDCNQQLLKKLLTEEIQPKDVHKAQQEVIMDRRQSAGSSPSCSSPTPIQCFSLDADDLSTSIQLLSEDNSDEMDKLWAPPPSDDAVPSELDEILKEEMRQNDLWLQHCIQDLL